VLRKWVKDHAVNCEHALPGRGKQRPNDADILRLRGEVAKTKAERDILKRSSPFSRRNRAEICLHSQASRIT
jgi:transposase